MIIDINFSSLVRGKDNYLPIEKQFRFDGWFLYNKISYQFDEYAQIITFTFKSDETEQEVYDEISWGELELMGTEYWYCCNTEYLTTEYPT